MNKCKRCGSQFDVLYDVGGELRCIHCAIVNGGVKVKSLDDLVADYNELAKQLAAARAERDKLREKITTLQQAWWCLAATSVDIGRAGAFNRCAEQLQATLTPDTEAT